MLPTFKAILQIIFLKAVERLHHFPFFLLSYPLLTKKWVPLSKNLISGNRQNYVNIASAQAQWLLWFLLKTASHTKRYELVFTCCSVFHYAIFLTERRNASRNWTRTHWCWVKWWSRALSYDDRLQHAITTSLSLSFNSRFPSLLFLCQTLYVNLYCDQPVYTDLYHNYPFNISLHVHLVSESKTNLSHSTTLSVNSLYGVNHGQATHTLYKLSHSDLIQHVK